MSVLIRVENVDQVGPYATGHVKFPMPSWNRVRPLPEMDNLGDVGEHDLFAFKDMDQFFDWFGNPEAIRTLMINHFFVTQITTDESVVVGNKQAKFLNHVGVVREIIPWLDVVRQLSDYRNVKEGR